MSNFSRATLGALISAVVLVGCGGGSGGGGGDNFKRNVSEFNSVGSVNGRAMNAQTGAPLANVAVNINGMSTTTDANGKFSLSNVPAGDRVIVSFNGEGYIPNTRIALLEAAGEASVQARMLPVAYSQTISAASGGVVSVPESSAQVTIEADSLVNHDGTQATGSATITVTPINPASDSSVMPGDFMAASAGSSLSPIESYGALEVSITDTAGNSMNLGPGKSATVRIPLGTRATSAPSTIPLFYFDTTQGVWRQEGTATLVTPAGEQAYYEGTVTHFSTWNADYLYDNVSVTGCVQDVNGMGVGGAVVASDGISYSGTSTAMTNERGDFTIVIKQSSDAALTAVKSGQLSNTRAVKFDADANMPECLLLNQALEGITVKLTWGEAPSDLDSHIWAPDGSHIFYSQKGALGVFPYVNLDVDDTDSYGPEVTTITKLMVGTYKFWVHNYSGYSGGSISASSMKVELNSPGRQELYNAPEGETSATDWVSLFELDVDRHCNVTVRGTQAFYVDPPTVANAAPQYCTP